MTLHAIQCPICRGDMTVKETVNREFWGARRLIKVTVRCPACNGLGSVLIEESKLKLYGVE